MPYSVRFWMHWNSIRQNRLRYGNRSVLPCHVDGKSDSSSLIVFVEKSLQACTSETSTRLSKARFTRTILCDASQGLCTSSRDLPESIQHPNRYSHDTHLCLKDQIGIICGCCLFCLICYRGGRQCFIFFVMILFSRASLEVGKLVQRCVSDHRW